MSQFTDAFGTTLHKGDVIVFHHKTTHSAYSRGAGRYVKAEITGFTQKSVRVRWLDTQQLRGYDGVPFKEAGYEGVWNPELCCKISTAPKTSPQTPPSESTTP